MALYRYLTTINNHSEEYNRNVIPIQLYLVQICRWGSFVDIKHFHDLFDIDFEPQYLQAAIENRNRSVFRWLRSTPKPISQHHLTQLREVISTPKETLYRYLTDISLHPHHYIMNALREKVYLLKLCSSGSVKALELYQSIFGIIFDTDFTRVAAEHNQSKTVSWLRTQGCPFNPNIRFAIHKIRHNYRPRHKSLDLFLNPGNYFRQ